MKFGFNEKYKLEGARKTKFEKEWAFGDQGLSSIQHASNFSFFIFYFIFLFFMILVIIRVLEYKYTLRG